VNYTSGKIGMNLLETISHSALGFCIGLGISYVYYATQKYSRYSRSFMQTLVTTVMIVAIAVAAVGTIQSYAFALVGILAILRFRTVVRDTREFTYIFLALAAGLAVGTSNYTLAVVGTTMVLTAKIALDNFNYGRTPEKSFNAKFSSLTDDVIIIENLFREFTTLFSLLSIEQKNPEGFILKYEVVLPATKTAPQLLRELEQRCGVKDIELSQS
jgi:uncharacterized membrane protein YhiD involved in acid resistance